MLTRVFIAAILAGLVGGIAFATLQHFRTTPLIITAEAFENQAEHSHDENTTKTKAPPEHGEAGHNHATDHEEPKETTTQSESKPEPKANPEPWGPENGFERTFYTIVANIAVAIGFAFLLSAASLLTNIPITPRNGALWGLVGFAVFSLSPAAGLHPELPGMQAADLFQRQIWWTACIAAGVIGVALIALKNTAPYIILGIAIIATPHLIGAPLPTDHDTQVPAHLVQSFVVNSLFVNAITWIVTAATLGFAFKSQKLVEE